MGDNLGFTPLHEAVTAGKLEAVKLLLRYARRTLHTFVRFSNEADASKSRTTATNRVNLLVLGGKNQDKYSPLHEAAEGDHVEIMREILEFVGQLAGTRAESEFPSLHEILDHRTSGGKSLLDLARSDAMNQLLTETAAKLKPLQQQVPVLDSDWLESDVFRVLLQNTIHRYVAARSVAKKFLLFRRCFPVDGPFAPEKIKAAVKNGIPIGTPEVTTI